MRGATTSNRDKVIKKYSKNKEKNKRNEEDTKTMIDKTKKDRDRKSDTDTKNTPPLVVCNTPPKAPNP